jgi:4-nitrophenyl phosphatase
VLTSAQATALYLPRIAPNAKRVHVLGGHGLSDALTKAGYNVVEQNADVVAVGIDVDLTYQKLKIASREIMRGAKFIGTNADKTFPAADGIVPGAGAILAALETVTSVAPIVVGKPERIMFDLAIEKMNAVRENAATLGDRLETDILGGQRAGLKSIMVMTGVTTPAILTQSSIRPDAVFDDLIALRADWQRAY